MKSKEASITNWQQNRELPIEKLSAVKFNWRTANPPLLARAMVGAGDMLFLAGPPDVLDETRLHGRFLQPAVVEQIRATARRRGWPARRHHVGCLGQRRNETV